MLFIIENAIFTTKLSPHSPTDVSVDEKTIDSKPIPVRRRSLVREFCLITSIHGLPGAARSTNILNFIFWSLSFICFMGFLVYFVVTAIQAYFQYPTKIDVTYERQYPQYFPAVSICNASPIRYDTFIGAFLNYTYPNNTNNITTISSNDSSNVFNFLIDATNKNQLLDSYFFSLTSMLYSCTFNSVPCSAADFISFTSPTYGQCYTINAKLKNSTNSNIRYTNENGGIGVLQLGLYVHSHEYLPYVNDGARAVIIVHDNTQVPTIDTSGIFLAPGRKHKLGYKKKVTSFLSSPYTDCTSSVSDSMKVALESYNGADYMYSENLCYEICQQTYVYQQCGCVSPFLWNSRSVILPGTDTIIVAPLCNMSNLCFSTATNTLLTSNSQIATYCSDCSQQCLLTNFIIEISSLKTPLQWQMNYIKAFVENSTVSLASNWSTAWREYIYDNYLSVVVALETITIENNTQTSVLGVVDIISNIGGQCGLWIGISFLSIFELIEMIYILIKREYYLIQQSRQRKVDVSG
ncbi:unnamed protein product [Rotaria sp. Silwood1]|nr:unnamed protein product [Rotaria sp. Silwood1]CAF1625087.1 unnamed protein product [Rotaria sp. Silwood1]CAF3880422.1 unnamed protein product [Rotaria sp. Silwood1]CAF4901743.1 unnamed protein product [Rotaria sp. Silwood1]